MRLNMSNQYYECHVTMIGVAAEIEHSVSKIGWKFSKIDGDPILGEGIKCYATKHYPVKIEANDVVTFVREASSAMKNCGHTVLRDKVELVIYDSKLVHI